MKQHKEYIFLSSQDNSIVSNKRPTRNTDSGCILDLDHLYIYPPFETIQPATKYSKAFNIF